MPFTPHPHQISRLLRRPSLRGEVAVGGSESGYSNGDPRYPMRVSNFRRRTSAHIPRQKGNAELAIPPMKNASPVSIRRLPGIKDTKRLLRHRTPLGVPKHQKIHDRKAPNLNWSLIGEVAGLRCSICLERIEKKNKSK